MSSVVITVHYDHDYTVRYCASYNFYSTSEKRNADVKRNLHRRVPALTPKRLVVMNALTIDFVVAFFFFGDHTNVIVYVVTSNEVNS